MLLNYKKDKTPFWNMLNIVPIMDDMKQVKAFLGTQVDVSEIIDLMQVKANELNFFQENHLLKIAQKHLG